jgi:hypothetical protein
MKQVLYVFLFMLCSTVVHAQQVVAAAGATSQTASGGISYTIGESVIETFAASGTTITQGFQQTKFVITAIKEIKDLGFTITAFPNPATDFVKLSVSNDKFTGLHYLLCDMNGKVISIQQLQSNETLITFSDVSCATYILKVFNGQQEVKSFKIIKAK